MVGRLKGKVAIVTGASRGIGRATSLVLAREGAAVIVNYDSSPDQANQVAEQIYDNGGQALAVRADVAEKSEISRLVKRTLSKFGQIDILVNNAGIAIPASILNMREEDLDKMIDVNLKGIFHCVQQVAPHMIERGYGKIINISSIAALGIAREGGTAYATTKGAVNTLTKRMAYELSPHGINVNSVAPGFILTDMTKDMLKQGTTQAMEVKFKSIRRNTLLNRIGQPEDIARTILFLASDEASFITAQVLVVDGGRMDFLSYSS